MQFTTLSSRWAALISRDPSASQAFIYSVITTKIYCRPTCPSRLARRSNIIFHNNAQEAEAAGFRPCKRCNPGEIDSDGDSQKVIVEKACGILREDFEYGNKRGTKELAKELGLTECHFCRLFKKITGVTVGQYKKQLVAMQDSSTTGTETSKEMPKSSDDVESVPDPSIFDETNSFHSNTLLYEDNIDAQAWMFTTELQAATDTDIFNFVDFEGVQDNNLLPCNPQELWIEAS